MNKQKVNKDKQTKPELYTVLPTVTPKQQKKNEKIFDNLPSAFEEGTYHDLPFGF